MEDLLYNLDSIESSYGENTLTSIVHLAERIESVREYIVRKEGLNDFEKSETADRLDKLVLLNQIIQSELQQQMMTIKETRNVLRVKLLAQQPH